MFAYSFQFESLGYHESKSWQHCAKHEVGNSRSSVPGPDEEWCNYSRVQWRESVSIVQRIPLHTHTHHTVWMLGTESHTKLVILTEEILCLFCGI